MKSWEEIKHWYHTRHTPHDPVINEPLWFDYKDEHPFEYDADEFSLTNALWLAEMSRLAYMNDTVRLKKIIKDAGFDTFLWLEKHDTEAFIAANDTTIIIAFRGTEISSWKDIRTDLNARKIETENCNHVHEGFYIGLQKIWDSVDDWVDNNQGDRKLWVCGHSLGGALATIAASRFKNVQGLYTYGSPRTGNDGFYEFMKKHTNNYRFVNSNDPVPLVPVIGFKHTGRKELLNTKGELLHDPKFSWKKLLGYLNIYLSIKQHDMRRYIAKLRKLLKGV